MMKRNIIAALTATMTVLSTGAAVAQNVVLNSYDKTASVTGELISFDNGLYIVQTSFGQMVISQSDYGCEGAACPLLTVETATPYYSFMDSGAAPEKTVLTVVEPSQKSKKPVFTIVSTTEVDS